MLFAEIDWPVVKDIVLALVAATVTLGVPYIGYLTIWSRMREQNLEGRIRTLEQHVKDCMETMETPWPSDDFKGKTFAQRVSEARQFAHANGLPWTFKDVASLAKKYLREKIEAKRMLAAADGPAASDAGGAVP